MTTRVEIMNDFLALNVKPGKTIQDIVEASGSALPFGCRDGECGTRSEEHTSELQSHLNLVCRLLLEKNKYKITI